MQDTYRLVSGVVFGVVAILQVVRAIKEWPVQIGPLAVPVYFSWVAFLVAGALAIWAFKPVLK
jgi:hypothetical protein